MKHGQNRQFGAIAGVPLIATCRRPSASAIGENTSASARDGGEKKKCLVGCLATPERNGHYPRVSSPIPLPFGGTFPVASEIAIGCSSALGPRHEVYVPMAPLWLRHLVIAGFVPVPPAKRCYKQKATRSSPS